MFEMRGIDKQFDAVVALKKASLTIEPGKITSLLGSNGSGKSTMVRVLAGLVNPNGGEVLRTENPSRSVRAWIPGNTGLPLRFRI